MPSNENKKLYIYKNGRYVIPDVIDKKVLDKIEYDIEHNTIKFPKYIIPLKFTDNLENTYYVKYELGNYLVDENGEKLNSLFTFFDNNFVINGFILDSSYKIVDLQYALFDNEYSDMTFKFPNTYLFYNLKSKLYRHHFDVVLTHDDLASIPSGAQVSINVNALSNSATPWSTLSELDGDGFIIAAFGTISYPQVVTSYVFELKIFYSSLNTLLINIHDLTDGSVKCAALTTVNGGSPNAFTLQDSVSAII